VIDGYLPTAFDHNRALWRTESDCPLTFRALRARTLFAPPYTRQFHHQHLLHL